MKLPKGIQIRNGSYIAYVTAPAAPGQKKGKPIRKAIGVAGCATVKELFRLRADLEKQVADGTYPPVPPPPPAPEEMNFVDYVEKTYLPRVRRVMKPSTVAGHEAYWNRYLKPRVGKYAIKDFTVAVIVSLLREIAEAHTLNRCTITKVRSILSAIFSYAIGNGAYPAKSAAENPAWRAAIPDDAKEPEQPKAATRDQVKAILAALKANPEAELNDMPLERAAVAVISMLGVRPGEARGLRWEEWDRAKQQIQVARAVWHGHIGTTKTPQSVRPVAVSAELREILLTLWNEQSSPLGGYILAAPDDKDKPVILDNIVKRTIRPRLEAVNRLAAEKGEKGELAWPGWYSLRRFHGTAVRAKSNLKTAARALGNSEAVAEKHYIRLESVPPDVKEAVNDAVAGLTA